MQLFLFCFPKMGAWTVASPNPITFEMSEFVFFFFINYLISLLIKSAVLGCLANRGTTEIRLPILILININKYVGC